LNSCPPICGNGLVETIVGEACDDGNSNSYDGCSAACAVEAGFSCYEPSPAAKSI